MPTHKSGDYKLSAVEYYLTEDKSQQEVCRIFKCSARSLMRWVEKYNKTGEIERHNRKPIAYKINQQEVKYILQDILDTTQSKGKASFLKFNFLNAAAGEQSYPIVKKLYIYLN
jgi:transposase